MQLVIDNTVPAAHPLQCSYSEASYFDGYHFQHIADFQEEQRLRRIRKSAQQAVRSMERRKGGRSLFASAHG